VGKTTISKILSGKLGGRHIELTLYAMENGLIIRDDPERDTKIVDMDALQTAIEKEMEQTEKPLIIDGHYSHELLEKDQVSLVIVLRKAPWALHEVLQNRLYSYEKIWENIDAEIMGVIAGEALEEFPVEKLYEADTTDKKPEETVEEIMDVIKGITPRGIEPIDWITYPETLRVLVNRTCTLS
jgi:adenylate kinase